MRKNILLLLLLSCCNIFAQKTVPYLQNPSPDSIRINWICEDIKALNNLKIIYGNNPDKLNKSVIAGYTSFLDLENSYKDNYFYCNAVVRNLLPDTKYYYKVISGENVSEIYSFRTQPKSGSMDIFRFLILGDHQLPDDRYTRLMKAAKDVCEEKYGTPIEDHIRFITNVGDQVDNGSLQQYKEIHFKQSALLSPYLPITTIVGNHETYGTLGLKAFENHYFHKDISYNGIRSNSEFYYAFQSGRALFIMLSSEPIHTNDTQLEWVKRIIEAAKTDNTVDWVFSYNHRPIQAEQYIGDISEWVRDNVIPLLQTTPKSVMNIGGHHHIYHKGMLRHYPMYHIISGGASWDQRWGMSAEYNFDDVQKTIDYFPFQIIELNPMEKKMTVETYAIGNEKQILEKPLLIDKFERVFGQLPPDKPSIVNIKQGEVIKLPFVFESSSYKTKTEFAHNSIQFQISDTKDYSNLMLDIIRYHEEVYGPYMNGSPNDINKHVDISRLKLNKDFLPEGDYFIRIRHRDENIEWSEWSDIIQFSIKY